VTAEPATFYYDLSSPYAYLAAARIDSLLPDATWRPIAFGIVIRERGKVPWSMGEGRASGIAEIERRAAARGLPPLRWPRGWPVENYSLAPLRASMRAEREGVLKPFTLALYRIAFAEGASLAEVENVMRAAAEVGLDEERVAAAIAESEAKERLRGYTDEALARGVTGVPTVAVGGRLFWGDDRLEEAAAAAAG
jgi:2-hydroxychromene-2-carboxylate isomerase